MFVISSAVLISYREEPFVRREQIFRGKSFKPLKAPARSTIGRASFFERSTEATSDYWFVELLEGKTFSLKTIIERDWILNGIINDASRDDGWSWESKRFFAFSFSGTLFCLLREKLPFFFAAEKSISIKPINFCFEQSSNSFSNCSLARNLWSGSWWRNKYVDDLPINAHHKR